MERYLLRATMTLMAWLAIVSMASAQTTVEYIHTDALGTPVAVTNNAGNVIERSVYEPYGQLINRPLADGPGFTGHVQDAATGLTYMQQRYYDPKIGMFLSVDPVSAYRHPVAQFNRYRYANSNPVRFSDPDGRCAASRLERICEGRGMGGGPTAAERRLGRIASKEANTALISADAFRLYDTKSQMAKTWSSIVEPVAKRHNVELASLTFETLGKFAFGVAYSSGQASSVDVKGLMATPRLGGARLSGFIHNHFKSLTFSASGWMRQNGAYYCRPGGGDCNGTGGDLTTALAYQFDAIVVREGKFRIWDYGKASADESKTGSMWLGDPKYQSEEN